MIPLEPNNELLTALIQRFNISQIDGRDVRAIVVDGKIYPIYSVVPKDTPFNYVLMNPVEYIDDSAKDSHSYECTQLWDVVTFGGERGSWKPCNYIVSEIKKQIMKGNITTDNFQSTVEPIVDSTIHQIEEVEGGLIMRALIRFRFNIQQI